MHACVVQIPEFRALRLRIPLTKIVAEGKDALLGTGLFFIAAGAADAGIELVFGDRFQQRYRLRRIARVGQGITQADRATFDRIFDRADDQALAEFGHALIAEGNDFGKIVTRIDVHQREGKGARTEGFFSDAQQHHGVLAARKKQGRIGAFGRHFAHDVDGFGLQPVQMALVDVNLMCHIRQGLFNS